MHFNPLPRKEGDAVRIKESYYDAHFNPLPRKEGDDFPLQRVILFRDFNPLPRKEGDVKKSKSLIDKPIYFNPLPRKEGDSSNKHGFPGFS